MQEWLERCTFPAAGTHVVCGVSGGADSSALLILAAAAELDVTAVHVDHGIRPGGAGEAARVEALAARCGARFRAERLSVAAGPNLEERARNARHKALGPEAMTGHTADDQAETLLINLLRGAGLRGLGAMEPGVRHPILALRRADTEAICAQQEVVPVEDPSNASPNILRNRVRNELLPLMADISQRDPVPLLGRTTEVARTAERALSQLAEGLLIDGVPVPTPALQAAVPALRDVALRQWIHSATGRTPSLADLRRIDDVVLHRSKATEISGGWRISRTGGQLSLRPAG